MTRLAGLRSRPVAILAAIAFANGVVAAVTFGAAAAGPLLRSTLEIGTGHLGVVLAAPGLGLMLGTFLWGELADRLDERRILIIAFLLFSAAAVVGAAAIDHRSTAGFTGSLVALGAFGSAAHSAGGRAITSAFPPDRIGLVLAIRHTAMPVGGAVGGVVLPTLARAHGFTAPMVGFAGFGVLVAAALAIALPRRTGIAARVRAAREHAHDALERLTVRAHSPLRDRGMWLLCIGGSSMAFVQLGAGAFLTTQLTDEAGLTITAAAATFTAMQLVGAVLRIALGVWSDRVASRVAMLRAIATVAFLVLVPMLVTLDGRIDGLLLVVALGVVTSCNGVAVAAASVLAPAGRTGATLGMQTTGNALAGTIAPVLLGTLLASLGWRAFDLCLLVVLAAGIVSLTLLDRTAHPSSVATA